MRTAVFEESTTLNLLVVGSIPTGLTNNSRLPNALAGASIEARGLEISLASTWQARGEESTDRLLERHDRWRRTFLTDWSGDGAPGSITNWAHL